MAGVAWRAPLGVLVVASLATSAGAAESLTVDGESFGGAFSEGLKHQTLQRLREQGESITILVCGESGLGKTSMLSSLFRTELVWPSSRPGQPTLRIAEKTVVFDLEGMPFSARLVDTPGYDSDVGKEASVVVERIEAGFRRRLQQEQRIRRNANSNAARQKAGQQSCVDVVLYFFSPHRCKKADMRFLRKLQGKASIVPVLAKADAMTADELGEFRLEVERTLAQAKVAVAHKPVAVICAERPAGGEPLGREYPWGLAESESASSFYTQKHSEIESLRRFLLIDGLLDLKQKSTEHYEAFRGRVLFSQAIGLKALIRRVITTSLEVLPAAMLFPQPRRFIKAKFEALRALLPARALDFKVPAPLLKVPPTMRRIVRLPQRVVPPPPVEPPEPPEVEPPLPSRRNFPRWPLR